MEAMFAWTLLCDSVPVAARIPNETGLDDPTKVPAVG